MIFGINFIFFTISEKHLILLEIVDEAHVVLVFLRLLLPLFMLQDSRDICLKFDVLALLETHDMLRGKVVDHLKVLFMIDWRFLELHLADVIVTFIIIIIFTLK